MGKSSKAPKTPDYAGLAQQQGEQDRLTAEYLTGANRPNQTDAFGNSITWNKDANGQWTQNTSMNPAIKGQWDQYFRNSSTAQTGLGNQLGAINKQGQFTAPEVPQYNPDGTKMTGGGGLMRPQGGPGGQAPSGADGNVSLADLEKISSGNPRFNSTAGQVGQHQGSNISQFTPGSLGGAQSLADSIRSYDGSGGKEVSDATYNAMTARTRQEQDRQQASLDNTLRMQGLQPGTEAYDRAMKNMMTARQDADYLASQNATLAGYDEANRQYLTNLQGQGQKFNQNMAIHQQGGQDYLTGLEGQVAGADNARSDYLTNMAGQNQQFNQDLSGYNANLASNSQRFNQNMAISAENRNRYLAALQGQGQKFGQELTEYNQPYQNAAMLSQLGTPYTPQFQGFSGATGYNPADLLGAANAGFNADMAKYNAGNSKKGSALGAGATLGAGYMMSDERLKYDIQPLTGKDALDKVMQLTGVQWRWKSDGSVDSGVIAQELERVLPSMVDSGELFKRVHYTGLVALLIESIKYLAAEGVPA